MPISAEEDCWRWRQGRGKLPDSREFAKQLQTLLIRSTAPLLLGSAGTQWDAILHPKSDCLNQCLRHTSVHPEMVRKAPCILTQPLAGCWGAEWGAKPSGTTPSCIMSHSGEFCRTTKKPLWDDLETPEPIIQISHDEISSDITRKGARHHHTRERDGKDVNSI